MPFHRYSIDRAIVMTQYDLRGFAHPLGLRMKMPSAKSLDALTWNFASFAAKIPGEEGRAVEPFPSFLEGYTYDEYLALCHQLYTDCECNSQKEAIRLIFEEIECQMAQIRAEELAGSRIKSRYTAELSKDNRWGIIVLAMKEVFGRPEKSQKIAA